MSGFDPQTWDPFGGLRHLSHDAHRFVEAVEKGEREAPDRAVELARRITELDPLLSPERRDLASSAMDAITAAQRGEMDVEEKEAIVAEKMERLEQLDDEMIEAAEELADLLADDA